MIIKVLKGTRAHGLTLVLPKATVDKMRDRLLYIPLWCILFRIFRYYSVTAKNK